MDSHLLEKAADEIERLRAKVTEMEKQKPYSYIYEYANPIDGSPVWRDTPGYWNAQYPRSSKPLYALPGAQNVPEKLCYDSRWEISIDYVDGWNAAVDMMRGKSPSWHCPDCCIAFPFGAPTSCPNDDARCNRLLAAAPEVQP